ncbi:MAG: DUF4384 domain-containing protein [Alkalinema sp. RU_4_3]|nr:DUF4384 domain-containing protein [Alkalinema sp. RU_4_3]
MATIPPPAPPTKPTKPAGSKPSAGPPRISRPAAKRPCQGIGLGSTGRNQLAADAPFDDFHAGAFTYLLTRALWQADPSTTLRQLFDQLAVNTKTLAQSARIFQNPTYSLPPGQKTLADRPPYFTIPDRPAAEGAIRPSNSSELEFWLGGIAPQALPAFNRGAQFAIIDDQGRTLGELEQTRRSGLIGYGTLKTGKLPTTLNPLLRETVRGIPADLRLRLGITPSLQGATATITQALEPLGRIQIAPDNIDIWLTQTPEQTLGLLQPDGSPLPTSFGPSKETPTDAITRLLPQLQSLLARRLLHTLGQNTTQGLKLAAQVHDVKKPSKDRRSFPAGRQIAIQVTNPNDQPLHIALIAIDSDGHLSVLSPTDWETLSPQPIPPSQTTTLPEPDGPFKFILMPPAGFLEVLVLGSTQPLQDALKGLRQIARSTNTRSGNPLTLQGDQPLEVTKQLFQSVSRLYTIREQSTIYDVDNRQLTSLSLTIEVTGPV